MDNDADGVTPVVMLDIASWRPRVDAAEVERHARALEAGGVLVLPRLAFALAPDETRFLDVRWSDGKREEHQSRRRMRSRARAARADELAALARDGRALRRRRRGAGVRAVPALCAVRARARARAIGRSGAAGRAVSWRKDDSRLHVDAFPSRPNHGERILRVFCNVNPTAADRVWRVGETFEAMARTLLPRIRAMLPGEAAVLAALHVTKGRRSEYDHLMLGLHDRAKADLDYQRDCAQREVRFAPGTTWICFSDQVMHAAVVGAVHARADDRTCRSRRCTSPQRSPLAVLERLTGPRRSCLRARTAARAIRPPLLQRHASCARCAASRRRTRRSG